MSRKPSLSPSRITTYLACPLKYRWTYVDPRGKWFLRAKSYYSFGLSLHAVLQRFHDSEDAGVQTTDEAIASLEENWVSAGYSSPEEAAEALAEGRELITAYLESPSSATPGAQTLFVEKQLRTDLGSFSLVGRIDRVDERADGSVEIIDYKSGEKWTENALKEDIALNCYAMLLRTIIPDKQIFTSIVSLKSGDKCSVEATTAALEDFKNDLVFIGSEIVNREYHEITPCVKGICQKCDFLPLCQRNEDFAEDYSALYGALETNPF